MAEVTAVGGTMPDTGQDTVPDTVVMRDTEDTVHMVVKDMHPTEETLKPNPISWNVGKITPVVMEVDILTDNSSFVTIVQVPITTFLNYDEQSQLGVVVACEEEKFHEHFLNIF